MNPVFIHILNNGDIWFSTDINFVPTGTILATYRVSSAAATQKLGTITATAGAVTAVSNGVGRWGKEAV